DTKDYKHLNSFIKKNIPIIFFDRVADEIDATKVLIDNFKAGYHATEHLIHQGCKEILHITGNLIRNVYNDRLNGYKKALEDNGIKYDQKLVISNDLSEKAIEDCLKNDVLKRQKLPDGLFITSDPSAAYALTILKEAGVKVPEDMAIIGFNNDLISRVCEPAISTINYPGNQMGETIASILINHLNGESDINYMNTVILKTDLIVRNSSLKKE